jgi:hypothetical protein
MGEIEVTEEEGERGGLKGRCKFHGELNSAVGAVVSGRGKVGCFVSFSPLFGFPSFKFWAWFFFWRGWSFACVPRSSMDRGNL